jgi:hypothetical protein
MSTLAATNLKHASSASNNIVLDSSGNATFAGTLVPNSSFLRNRIINGDMVIDQRNAGASVTPGDGNFTLDRWKMSLAQASKLSVQRSTVASTGFVNSLLATSLSAYSLLTGDTFGVYQPIEGFNVADLGWGTANAQTVTVSFWVRGSLTGTYSVAVYNAAGNRSCVVSYVINAANTWEYKTVTITGDTTGTWATDNTAGIQVRWDLGSGATYGGATSGTWNAGLKLAVTGQTSVVGTNGATFYLTGVQLEVGTAATPFERRQYGQELALCQRYYEKSYNINTVPGSSSDSLRFEGLIGFAKPVSSFNEEFTTRFSVGKRSSTTVVVFNPDTGASGGYRDFTNSANRTGILILDAGTSGFKALITDAVQEVGGFQFTAAAEL